MSADMLPVLIQRFFTEYLHAQRNLSAHTIAAYRDTFRLLLGFLAQHLRVPVDKLSFQSLTPDGILAFLDGLETSRGNTPRTRNCRLAAIHTFARYSISLINPEIFAHAHRILSIPFKQFSRPGFSHFSREEIDAILFAFDKTTWSGQRDHMLFTLLYNTGARISEALQITPDDLQGRTLLLHGKGRKDRAIPLWTQTASSLRRWCKDNDIHSHQPIFINKTGTPLTRHGARFRMQQALMKAAATHPQLRNRKLGLHSIRHSCAMHLLQAGVSLEVIALWLGHEQLVTTHGYVEADMNMKENTLLALDMPKNTHRKHAITTPSSLISFLDGL